MSDEWEDKGECGKSEYEFIDVFLPESMWTRFHAVENIETGEIRRVRVDPGQTVGEAIAEGQFIEED